MHTAYIQPPGVPPVKVCYIVTYKSCHILGALHTYRIFGTSQTNETQERTAPSGNQDRNDGNQVQDNGGQYFGPMFLMEVEDEFLKTKVPTVVMYHKSFQCCEAEECCYHWNAKYMEPPPTTCYSGCIKKQKYYRQNFLSNAYFCFRKMDCLQKIIPGVRGALHN